MIALFQSLLRKTRNRLIVCRTFNSQHLSLLRNANGYKKDEKTSKKKKKTETSISFRDGEEWFAFGRRPLVSF